MNTHRVFVYGTLMRGLRNHHMMAGAKFCFETTSLLPAYEMVQFPSTSSPGNVTPGLRRNGQSCIAGEVFQVDDDLLDILDEFEGVGEEYERGKIMLADGSKAWAYFLIAKKGECAQGTPSFIDRDEETKIVRWNGVEEERVNMKKRAA